MPLIQVNMIQGRSAAERRRLLGAITQAVHDSIGAPVESIRVWIHELDPENFITAGVIAADRAAAADPPAD